GQEHSGGSSMSRLGAQRRSHSRATGWVWSAGPPGQLPATRSPSSCSAGPAARATSVAKFSASIEDRPYTQKRGRSSSGVTTASGGVDLARTSFALSERERQRVLDAVAPQPLGVDPEDAGHPRSDLSYPRAHAREVHRPQHLDVDAVGDVLGLLDPRRADEVGQRPQALGHRAPEPEPRALRDALGELARRPAHERQRAVQEGRVFQAERRVAVDALAKRRDRVRAVLREAVAQLAQVADQHEDEQLLLGGDVAVDERLVDPDRPRDAVDRRLLDALLVEEQSGRGDDLALA